MLQVAPTSKAPLPFRSTTHRVSQIKHCVSQIKRRTILKTQASAADASNSTGQHQRRQLLLAGLLAVNTIPQLPALAEDAVPSTSSTGKKAFFDMAVNGQPAGRIVVQLYDDVPVGAQRFKELTEGKDGVSFRRTKIEFLSPDNGYIRSASKKELSRRASGRVRLAGGDSGETLELELSQRKHIHDAQGVVSLGILSKEERVTKEKLVAIKGQFVTVTETFGELPNGSAVTFTCQPEPDLDDTHLVVGRIVQGIDVVQKLAALPRVANNSESPFFKAGKAAGDKRADVAERAFGKPFSKITIQECGLL